MFVPRSVNCFFTQYLPKMGQATVFDLKTVWDGRNSCHMCPALICCNSIIIKQYKGNMNCGNGNYKSC